MKIRQIMYRNNEWKTIAGDSKINPALVLCQGNRHLLADESTYNQMLSKFPGAVVISCSTAGEISNEAVSNNTLVATAVEFSDTKVLPVKININDFSNSFNAGKALIAKLEKDGLRFILVFSDGELVNGDDLVSGMNESLVNKVPIAGGLAGDDTDFNKTLVGLNNDITEGNIVAVGFYGDRLQLGFGLKGGWRQFGPTRTITKSKKNVLYEIDGENALDLYKTYLGVYADKLPGSALLFPLSIKENNSEEIVRTILNVDAVNKTMTFAGNVSEGAKVRLMKTTLDNIVDAASEASDQCKSSGESKNDTLAILISCVGRKIILGNRIDEEFDAVRESLGVDVILSGFYSYGEIAPFTPFMKCQLHNQTIAITTMYEN